MTPSLSDTETAATSIQNAHHIVLLIGAGISTAAGIPDFRSDKTGLYARLAPLNLPFPEAIFHINYFRHTPEPFYAIAKARHPRNLKPTLSHAFLGLLAKKDRVHFLFTQNIDGLEEDAFVPPGKMLAAHGNWKTQRCWKCKAAYPDGLMKRAIAEGEVPYCQEEGCDGPVKPDVVFFGESLPEVFEEKEKLVDEADLMIVVGTSLKVAPCSRLPRAVREGVPRILINQEKVGDFGSRVGDVCLLGSCDESARALAGALGWGDELESLWGEAVAAKESMEGDFENETSIDECIRRLAQENQGKMISDGHKKMLETHLESKFARLSTAASKGNI
ncbi:DeAcetylase [Aspergillus nanangensis]|uniref:NAD-dependent protein deacetylase n=1 Tax=Aspergillus nanangensis TaxID=2582783 RepID=A0AAD4CZH5_ASPNN|nr:DeAcetylase [Aspergillus nanangensis]